MALFSHWLFWLKNWRFSTNSCKEFIVSLIGRSYLKIKIRKLTRLLHWRSSIELTKAFENQALFFWNNPFHKRLAQIFLGSYVYWLINLEGDNFPLMLEFKTLGLLHVIAYKNIYRYCKNKTWFNIPHKAPYDLDSSLLSPQSSLKSQILKSQIHLPLLHWNSYGEHDDFPKCKTKLTDNN